MKIKCILPSAFCLGIGLFYFFKYENVIEVKDSYNGIGIFIDQFFILSYGLIGRYGTVLLLIGLSALFFFLACIRKRKMY